MKVVETLIAALVVPLLLLSTFGGFVAFAWLAYLGEWNLILIGFSLFAASYFIIGFVLLLPVGGLMILVMKAFERGWSAVGFALGFLSNLYSALLEIVWGVSVFLYFGQRSTETNGIPLWILSFCIGTGIFTILASKSYRLNPNPIQFVGAVVNQSAFVFMSVAIIFLGWSLLATVLAVAILKLIPVLLSLWMLAEERRDLALQQVGRY